MRFLVNVDGRCLEQLGMMNGDIIEINTDLAPRAGDVVWCMIEGKDSLKEYVGCVNGVHVVTTRYASRTIQAGLLLSGDKVRGVAEACYTPTGALRWARGCTSPLHGESLRYEDCTPIRRGADAE